MRCTGRCHLPIFHTSESLHGDDYVLNYKSSHAAVTCAVPSTVSNDYLRNLGMGEISKRAFFSFKAAFEPICAHAAHASMAAAVEQEECELVKMSIFDIRKSHRGAFIIDGGYATGRNAQCCTMPGMTSGTHRIFNVEIARLKDEGATSSQGLEKRCFTAMLAHPLVKRLISEGRYYQVGMDGAAPLISAAQAAGLEVQGDGWHFGKNRCKHFKR